MEKTYNPHSIEQRWYETWEKNDNFSPKGGDESFSIIIPHGNQALIMQVLQRKWW